MRTTKPDKITRDRRRRSLQVLFINIMAAFLVGAALAPLYVLALARSVKDPNTAMIISTVCTLSALVLFILGIKTRRSKDTHRLREEQHRNNRRIST